ncbi:cytochrome c oxidase assembly factor 8 [Genypterus blacodes]|uniref:cytochrome c oxidase assembly factor 8 n=1 Tax=Genypterus blacodes TaxID=154954 RepID=UPI003F76181E
MASKTASVGFLTWRSSSPITQQRLLSAASSRRCNSEQVTTKATKQPKRSKFMPAASSTHDWIGPPNILSNLRPIVYRIPENETELEKRLRHLRQETEEWNHEFWKEQNITFSKEKDGFIISQLKAKGLSPRDEQGRRRSLNSEDMAVFYKSFLDRNRIRHANYNKEWYRRNFTITLFMARVTFQNMWTTVADRRSGSKKNTPTT